jgi:nicotinamide-nucleotide amidase
MIGEVVAIGDELTSGERLDTNSQWIGRRLTELGVRVGFHSTVGDDLAANVRVFQQAIDRADIVVSTGGLGPTADDLTREALASATNVELYLDHQALADIKALFVRRGREMPARNELQAMFPTGSQAIANPHGSAPGIAMEIARPGRRPCRWFALPGVPTELIEMWEQTVSAAVADATGRKNVIRHRTIKCFGVGESNLEQMLPDVIRRGRVPSVGITVHEGTITLRITSEGATEADCFAGMEETIRTIHECLGSLVFGSGDDELENAVARLLDEQKQHLATVEWGTGGLIARYLSSVKELQPWYLGGLLVPNPTAAAKLLEIPSSLWTEHKPTSAAAAEAMAVAMRDHTGAELGLAVSDIPHLPDAGHEPESFHVALATPTGVQSRGFAYAAHPAIAQPLAAKRALNYLRLALAATSSP